MPQGQHVQLIARVTLQGDVTAVAEIDQQLPVHVRFLDSADADEKDRQFRSGNDHRYELNGIISEQSDDACETAIRQRPPSSGSHPIKAAASILISSSFSTLVMLAPLPAGLPSQVRPGTSPRGFRVATPAFLSAFDIELQLDPAVRREALGKHLLQERDEVAQVPDQRF